MRILKQNTINLRRIEDNPQTSKATKRKISNNKQNSNRFILNILKKQLSETKE